MCCGAVIVSNISSVVVGARHPAEENRWGEHTMEKGLSITGWDRENRLVTDILSRECLALLQKWDVRRSAARDQGRGRRRGQGLYTTVSGLKAAQANQK